MTALREAAQQALDACEQRLPLQGQATIIDELNALRAALAKPCPCGDRPAAQCPGEWEPGCDLGNNPKYAKRVKMTPKELAASIKRGEKWKVAEPVLNPAPGYCKHCKQYTIEEPLTAEPVQEPVAKVELMLTGGNAGLATRIVEIDDHLRERLRPGQLLYTAPPQRKPLTEEEIDELAMDEDGLPNSHLEFARAVERAHGIG